MGQPGRRGGQRPERVAAHREGGFLTRPRLFGRRPHTPETAPAAPGLQAAALYAGAFSSVLSAGAGRPSRRAEGITGSVGGGQRCGGYGRNVRRGAQAPTEGAEVSGRAGGGARGGVCPALERDIRCPRSGGMVDRFPGASCEMNRLSCVRVSSRSPCNPCSPDRKSVV